ncbi:MAG TPA: PfkB family carbohydrate kinase [Vicinamibacteria bacterium]|nr:PfkB family carbohydrate kinase [Vicinamibacteria bacterium]
MPIWDAIGVGLAVRDISVLMDRYPRADEKLRASAFYESGGGPVATALVTLARFGRSTAISAVVGEDPVGKMIVDGLRREGVDTEGVAVRNDFVSPTSVIIVENGRRTILEAPHGVGFPLSWEAVRRLPLSDCRALLVDARCIDVQIRAAREARRAGAIVVLDCGHPREGVEELLTTTDVAILSHTYSEAAAHEPRSFLGWLLDRLPRDGPAIAGVTLGEKGCAIASRSEPFTQLAGHRVTAVDTTGAGDVFHGAFVHAWLDSRSAIAAARFANCAAAVKCAGMTGRASLPSAEELWRLSTVDAVDENQQPKK